MRVLPWLRFRFLFGLICCPSLGCAAPGVSLLLLNRCPCHRLGPAPLARPVIWLIAGPVRLPRDFPCSHGSTHAVCTIRGRVLGTVLGRELHGCCALVSAHGPRRRWPSPDALRERSLHDRLLAEDGEVKVALFFSDHLSHTTPSPSPSLALGTIHFGKPLPLPLLP